MFEKVADLPAPPLAEHEDNIQQGEQRRHVGGGDADDDGGHEGGGPWDEDGGHEGGGPEDEDGGHEEQAAQSGTNNVDEDMDESSNDEDQADISFDAFERGKKIYHTQDYSIYVKKVGFKRRTRYSLDDHLYDITFKMKPGHARPKLLSIQRAIGQAIDEVINLVQPLYPRADNNQIYVAIESNHIENGISTGNFHLYAGDDVISRQALSNLYNYLKSNQTLRLDPSFKIRLTILTVKTMAHRLRKRYRKGYGFKPHYLM